jgi:hypothetical protein
MKVVSAAPLLPRSSFSTWTMTSMPSATASWMRGAPRLGVGPEVAAGDLLERQEAVAFRAVVDEGRLETGLYPGDDAFVDIAFALFLAGRLDVEVDELLTVDDRNTEFLGLCRVEQHALHLVVLLARRCKPRRLTGVCR